MAIDLPEPYHRGLFASHTFTCALTTRGGICDCLPPPASEAGATVALVGTGKDEPSATSAPTPTPVTSQRRRAARTQQRDIAAQGRDEGFQQTAERSMELGRDDLAALAHDRAERARRPIGA